MNNGNMDGRHRHITNIIGDVRLSDSYYCEDVANRRTQIADLRHTQIDNAKVFC